MKKDYKKDLKNLYNPSPKEVNDIIVPSMNFLMIDGKGSPGECKEWADAIETLYPVAYTIKFSIKKDTGFDFGVMPLEGLWWAEDMNDFTKGNRDNWLWTIMIMQPEVVTKDIFEKAVTDVKKKKQLASIEKLRFENFNEGKCAQLMHIGPFSEEGPNIIKIHQWIKNNNGLFDGKIHKHHEIYLNDVRKVNPLKMKTILRQPYIQI
jgi:hypothetical protein